MTLNQKVVDENSVDIINSLNRLYEELRSAVDSGTVKLSPKQKDSLEQDISTMKELIARLEAKELQLKVWSDEKVKPKDE